eukprot:scaffold68847_cov68-Phaeocystis_antarctica.AAC.3
MTAVRATGLFWAPEASMRCPFGNRAPTKNALFWLASIIAFQCLSKKRNGRSLTLGADSASRPGTGLELPVWAEATA